MDQNFWKKEWKKFAVVVYCVLLAFNFIYVPWKPTSAEAGRDIYAFGRGYPETTWLWAQDPVLRLWNLVTLDFVVITLRALFFTALFMALPLTELLRRYEKPSDGGTKPQGTGSGGSADDDDDPLPGLVAIGRVEGIGKYHA